jgi:asparagine synthase (glutamine-hydrolysing)
MCGLAGVASLNGRLDPAIRAAVPAMTRALRHRGPDGEGIRTGGRWALGHRRLAIIDKAGGTQPMSNEDRSVWVVFNGEIYNHRSLRKTLTARGHRFRTVSDTEVIVHAYEEYGVRCPEYFEGMFAFALYDESRHEALLACDRMGKKPLYYAVFDGTLHFASEIKALRCSPAWDGALDLSGLDAYLSLGYFLSPRTVYRHVRRLEPGHWLHARASRLVTRKYWDIEQFDDESRGTGAVLDDVAATLHEAVQDRLESEVPLGAFLSGGIDSGLVVSYMAEASRQPVVTTTVGFGERGHDELAPARMTAERWGTRHHEERARPQLDELIDPIVRAFDEPFADSSAISTYIVSGAARRHVTVALSGDGGDETFGGYDFRYVPHGMEDGVRRWMGPGSRHLARSLAAVWPRRARMPRWLRWSTVLQNLSTDAATAYYADLCFLKAADTQRLLGLPELRDPRESAVHAAVTEPYLRCPSRDPIQKAEYADVKIYLANDVLVKLDRMSMAHGLEVRSPLLDRRLVELAFRIPRRIKLPNFRAKYLLRQLAARRLPRQVVTRPKQGFTAPVGEWIRGPYRDVFRAEVLGPGATVPTLLDARRVRTLLDEQCTGIANHSYALWAIWMLERWARGERARNPGIASVQDSLPTPGVLRR